MRYLRSVLVLAVACILAGVPVGGSRAAPGGDPPVPGVYLRDMAAAGEAYCMQLTVRAAGLVPRVVLVVQGHHGDKPFVAEWHGTVTPDPHVTWRVDLVRAWGSGHVPAALVAPRYHARAQDGGVRFASRAEPWHFAAGKPGYRLVAMDGSNPETGSQLFVGGDPGRRTLVRFGPGSGDVLVAAELRPGAARWAPLAVGDWRVLANRQRDADDETDDSSTWWTLARADGSRLEFELDREGRQPAWMGARTRAGAVVHRWWHLFPARRYRCGAETLQVFQVYGVVGACRIGTAGEGAQAGGIWYERDAARAAWRSFAGDEVLREAPDAADSLVLVLVDKTGRRRVFTPDR